MLLFLSWHPLGRVAGLAVAAALLAAPDLCAEPSLSASAAVSAAASDAPEAQLSTTTRVGVVTAVAGGVLVLAGVGTGFLAKAREQDGWSTCRRGSDARPECPASARSDFDAAQSYATATNVLLLGGGLLTVAGLGLTILGGESRSRARQPLAQVELTPSLERAGAGLSLRGAF